MKTAQPGLSGKLAKLADQVRTGGKGSVRRKRKTVHKSAASDDKRLQAVLAKLPHCNQIPNIEEVNIFRDDGTVIHFVTPKVQTSLEANTFSITGQSETKKLQELLPGILNQLGFDNLMQLKDIAAHAPPKASEEDAPKPAADAPKAAEEAPKADPAKVD